MEFYYHLKKIHENSLQCNLVLNCIDFTKILHFSYIQRGQTIIFEILEMAEVDLLLEREMRIAHLIGC